MAKLIFHKIEETQKEIIDQIQNLVDSGKPRDLVLKETAHLLKEHFPKYNWVGFYLMDGNELALGPYVGKPSPHTRIKLDSGICGAAVREEQTIIVLDVNADLRYLECSLETKSEIVVPIRKGDKIVGEIDIDSDELSAFDEQDKNFLENLSQILSISF
ncbi:MAG: hypothetical protein RBG1_1C00001G1213 [candidate division Zixibacteria bacterium RBG-1]|nr:MAG: hypothetical protein RBG1_1C00001G1213 [candidate division Zixibacteria bacterium RBG-1]OGC83572.1 MAG: hypothetical protein A2V73_03295 [candidate division Zixibacteria bacterium RBG_19FT_COMBO_42_43]